jgi:hypothetical protein
MLEVFEAARLREGPRVCVPPAPQGEHIPPPCTSYLCGCVLPSDFWVGEGRMHSHVLGYDEAHLSFREQASTGADVRRAHARVVRETHTVSAGMCAATKSGRAEEVRMYL